MRRTERRRAATVGTDHSFDSALSMVAKIECWSTAVAHTGAATVSRRDVQSAVGGTVIQDRQLLVGI